MKRIFFLFLISLWSMQASATTAHDLAALKPPDLSARQASDREAVLRYRNGLREVISYVSSQPQIFPPANTKNHRLLSQEEREAVRQLWARTMDYYLALDSIAHLHADFHKLSGSEARATSFRLRYAAFLAQYRSALEFIAAARHEPGLDILLNEPMPALGVPAGSYDRFKFRFLNVARATEYTANEALRQHYRKGDATLGTALVEDAKAVMRIGQGHGQFMTLVNAGDIVRKGSEEALFPVQAGVAEWMGDTKVYRVEKSLISAAQIAELPKRLEPGDILLERREWYVSNVGLPGYWPHAALYVGSPEERARYFDTAEVREWVKRQGEASGNFEQLLQRRYPKAQEEGVRLQHGHPYRVIEAISEGVSFTTIEHSADADALAVLRPRLNRIEKALAVLRAYGYIGRPYDFNFDFRSDASLVCSELIYKVYEPLAGMKGLQLPVNKILGRLTSGPNDYAEQFDRQFGTPEQQSDLVVFLDGNELGKSAVEATLEEFRRSWKRPKWHILTQPKSATAKP